MTTAETNWDSQAPAPGLPRVIARKLSQIARKYLRVQLQMGLICAVAAFCILLIVQLTADWLMDLSRPIRALFLVGDALIFGALAWWFALRPWTKRLNQEKAALKAEKHWPNLRSSIISAVQLSKKVNGSSTMVEELLRQAAQSVEGLDFRQAVSSKHLVNPAYGTSGLVALTLLGLALTWSTSQVLLQRALLAKIPLPTQTIVVPISGNMDVPPGTTVELAAQAQGIVPKSGRVEITYAGQKPLTLTLSPKPNQSDVFATSLQNLQQSFQYRIYLNDGRSEQFQVKVIHGPVLDSIGFEQFYPAYTELQPTQHGAGNLNLLSGGKLKITAKADQPLKNAKLVLEPRAREQALTVAADGISISGELDIPKEELESFTIVLTNREDAESVNNTVYHVSLTPDTPPNILFGEDQPSFQTIVPNSRPPLVFEIRDDFMVKTVAFCARAEGDEGGKEYRIPLDVPQTGARLSFNQIIQDPIAAGLPWKEGTNLTWWIEGTDNNDVTGPGIGKSSERQWSIISLQEKQQEILDKLNKSAQDIRNLSRTQEDLRQTVREIEEGKPAP